MKEHEVSSHVLPLYIYLIVGCGLLVFTLVTVAVSFINLGGWNVVVAIFIASIKAILVALFFMHLLYDNKFYALIFSFAVLFLAVLIVFTLFDTLNRGDIYDFRAVPIKEDAVIYDKAPNTQEKSDATADSSESQHK